MNQTSHSSKKFDPIAVWPARIRGKRWTANAHNKSGGVGGATDLRKREAFLPVANTAYDRTIRLHEALHAIYSAPPTKERIASAKPYTMLEQALEDARLHLNCAKTEGHVRRDEMATALRDLHNSKRCSDKNLCALIALRSAAILNAQPDSWSNSALKRFAGLCETIDPNYAQAVADALGAIGADDMSKAEALLAPYFRDAKAMAEEKVWPSMGMGSEESGDKPDADVSFDKVEGKLSSDAAEMLGKRTIAAIRDGKMPTLNIHQLFARDNVPTFFGETQKHMISGCKIHAKKLAMIVGPTAPRLFLKTIRRNGGTVVIDASGSMDISEGQLLKLLKEAPAATIAFYNAPTDDHMVGNMWIFAHKGKRAADLDGIEFVYAADGVTKLGKKYGRKENWPDHVYGYGNVVDFQVLQWLIAQPGPRYILTDGMFTGPKCSQQAAHELLGAAIARKKITQIRSLKEMETVLAKGQGKL